jgi:chitinase
MYSFVMRSPIAWTPLALSVSIALVAALPLACGGGGASTMGAAGNGGMTGSAGTTGAAGTGPAGDQTGAAGDQTGAAGATGAAGTSGAAGTMGAAGNGGKAGTNGAAGSGGKAGTTGAAGMGAAGTTGAAGMGGQSNFPARFAAPYVETWSRISLTNLATATGHKFYTLAFMLSSGCSASWNGDTPLANDDFYGAQITALRKTGGDVIISFGGASGTELATACKTVESLQAAYQAVITKYALTWMDLDIEGGAESATADVDRRNKALKNLQAANPGLRVSYTLAVDPTGLPQAQRALLSNAKTNGVRVDTVNVMAMDYGPCDLDMGQAAIMAAQATKGQLQSLGTSSAVGVTPMTGVNDVACENFTTANATSLVDYAQANAYINLLAFWAMGRDGNHAYLNIFKTLH